MHTKTLKSSRRWCRRMQLWMTLLIRQLQRGPNIRTNMKPGECLARSDHHPRPSQTFCGEKREPVLKTFKTRLRHTTGIAHHSVHCLRPPSLPTLLVLGIVEKPFWFLHQPRTGQHSIVAARCCTNHLDMLPRLEHLEEASAFGMDNMDELPCLWDQHA
jgi:hypothetical protein